MMLLKRVWISAAAVLFCGGIYGQASAAEEGTVKILAPWESQGQVFRVGPDQLLFMGTADGIMYIEDGSGSLDAALFVCPGTHEISLKDGAVSASGNCTITGSQGGTIFAKYECSGQPGTCDGKFTLNGGTEEFKGITGSGDMVVRTALEAMVKDLQSGATVSGAAGLAVWPELSYKIP